MNQSNQSKQVLLSVIGVAILVVAVVGVSFAFFNYTRTGAENTVSTGKIYFNHTQAGAIELTNVFPLTSAQLQSQVTNNPAHKDYAEVVVTIQGNTTYSEGLDYRVSAQSVDFATSTGLVLPVNVEVTASGLGSSASSGNVDRVVTTSYTSSTPLRTGDLLAEGHIQNVSPETAWVRDRLTGTLTIRAYIDAGKIAITDTLAGGTIDAGTPYTNGTTGTPGWVNGRLRLTTDEWNSLTNDKLSFSIRVESVEAGGGYDFDLS